MRDAAFFDMKEVQAFVDWVTCCDNIATIKQYEETARFRAKFALIVAKADEEKRDRTGAIAEAFFQPIILTYLRARRIEDAIGVLVLSENESEGGIRQLWEIEA